MSNVITRSVDSLYQVFRGLSTVFAHTFRPPITKEFPDSMPPLPGTFRGRLALAVNPDNGEHLCISCLQCERVCPDKCIQITSHKSPETNKPELIDFKIDHGLCMFCGLCTEVCPTNCIINTGDFEMADYSRSALVYDLKKLTLTQEESTHYYDKKQLPKPKPKPAKPAAATGAAAKPAAAAPAVAAKAEAPAQPAQETAKPEAPVQPNAAAQEAAKPGGTPGPQAAKPQPAASEPAAPKAAEAKPETAATPEQAAPKATEAESTQADKPAPES